MSKIKPQFTLSLFIGLSYGIYQFFITYHELRESTIMGLLMSIIAFTLIFLVSKILIKIKQRDQSKH